MSIVKQFFEKHPGQMKRQKHTRPGLIFFLRTGFFSDQFWKNTPPHEGLHTRHWHGCSWLLAWLGHVCKHNLKLDPAFPKKKLTPCFKDVWKWVPRPMSKMSRSHLLKISLYNLQRTKTQLKDLTAACVSNPPIPRRGGH